MTKAITAHKTKRNSRKNRVREAVRVIKSNEDYIQINIYNYGHKIEEKSNQKTNSNRKER